MDFADRVQRTVSVIMSLILALALFLGLYEGQWFNAFLALLALVLSYIPALVERNYQITLPVEFEFTMVVFLFLTIYLGSIHGYYEYYWWWDVFLHALSGVILGLVGFFIVYILRTSSRLNLNISPAFVGLFSFLFAVTLGTLWEILEFLIDSFRIVQPLMQPDNFDTMKDLIDDSLGAFLVACGGYLYCRKVRVPILDRIMGKFVEKNPSMFHRLKLRSKDFLRRRMDAVKKIRIATLGRVRNLLKHFKRSKNRR